ncbi:MAG TPA: LysM peptidoglycan-binding domain-containing protein [Vicinamibacterales bacterium]|jgi:membrane-bound lytic murein transglycosylase D
MVLRDARPVFAVAVLATTIAGCSTRSHARLPVVAPPPVVAQRAQPTPPLAAPADPIATLIQSSQRHFEAGQQELSIGHLDRAKQEFNQAVDVLLQSPYGARYDARLREHFDRLVDRISAYEVVALAEGDGFTEKRYEPAPIDTLLDLSTTPPSSPSDALKQAVASDLRSTTHDIAIPLNARVLEYIELFQGRLREWFGTGLRRGARYLPMIQQVFRAEGLPLDLAYVPLIESAFNPNAVSRAKAKGVWQFMAGTALEHGLKRDWYVDERSDPEKATRAAARYLETLATLFDGDWHLALASYNGGPGLVQRAVKRTGLVDFWSLSQMPKALPRETREYVPMILAAVVIARNPAQYGFDLVPSAPVEYDKVKVPRPVDLRRIAEWAGVNVSDIQELNPELRRWTTPVRYPDYEVKVPRGTAGTVEERLAELAPTDLAALKRYTVKKGETLVSIANKLRVSRVDLADANYLSTKARVSPGQNLIIPVEPTLLLAGRPDRPAPLAESRPAASSERLVLQTPSGDLSERVRLVYRVKSGDTLYSVARVYQTSVASLKQWNSLRDDRLVPGARLTIFASRGYQAQHH